MISEFKQSADKAIAHLEAEYAKLQAGRASAALVDNIMVDSYGSPAPLKTVANVSIPDAATIQIQPWDKSMLAVIEKAIQEENLGINPVNNGIVIILNIPAPTEERRRDLVKSAKTLAEECRITVRQARGNANDQIKNADLPEDQQRDQESELQEAVHSANKRIDDIFKSKETDIMTV